MRGDDAAGVRRLAAQLRPGAGPVRRLGAGEDHVAYAVGDDLVVRVAADVDAADAEVAASVRREVALLSVVAEVSPVPVPEVVAADPAEGWLAQRRLPGVPLLEVPEPRRPVRTVAAVLGRLLGALHAVPAERVGGIVEVDDTPAAEWLAETAELAEGIIVELPADVGRAIDRFIRSAPPPPAPAPVLAHDDLGIEHVLVDPATLSVTGVIDWSDAGLTDAAHDFGKILRDLGPAALDAALEGYGATGAAADEPALRSRALFHARCTLVEDWAYGIRSGRPAYAAKSRAAAARLFPD